MQIGVDSFVAAPFERVSAHLRDLYSYLLKNRCIQAVRGYREE